jgi:hypothetical protein
MAGILQAIRTATFSDRKYVGDLRAGSQTVNRINELFASHSEKFSIISFWEARATRIIGVRISILSTDLTS